jgi:hypothetical protein
VLGKTKSCGCLVKQQSKINIKKANKKAAWDIHAAIKKEAGKNRLLFYLSTYQATGGLK